MIQVNRSVVHCAIVCCLCSLCVGAESKSPKVSFRSDFEKANDFDVWTVWNPNGDSIIRPYKPGCSSETAALFGTRKGGWNTPIVMFEKNLGVSADTVVQFDIKSNVSGAASMNIRNADDGGEYALGFTVGESGKWVTVRKYLSGALYKRYGKAGVRKDGLVGDRISSIQIATRGDVCIDNFTIVQASEQMQELPLEESESLPVAKLHKYETADKMFPFGVISNVSRGNRVNGTYFGQSYQERFEEDLADIKRHYMNTYVNFCDGGDIGYRLKMMDKYALNLIEACLSNADLRYLAENHEIIRSMKRYVSADRLLAWYGKDEPSEIRAYLQNKLRANEIDPNRPYVSALCHPEVVQKLGPHLEYTMIDPYMIQSDMVSVEPLLNIVDCIRQAQSFSGTKKIWLISQAYSLRHLNAVTLRYPTESEMRFCVYSAIACGVKGIIFFIYNDSVGYLDGRVRVEEFDQTLVDPWGNDNPTYQELSEIGKAILPVMYVMSDTEVMDAERIVSKYDRRRLFLGGLENEYGKFLVFANKDLRKDVRCHVELMCAGKERVYDLLSLSEISCKPQLSLQPGGGAFLLIATADKFSEIRRRVVSNRLIMEKEVLRVDLDHAKTAGLDVHTLQTRLNNCNSLEQLGTLRSELKEIEQNSRHYWEARNALDQAKKTFGDIHSLILTRVQQIESTQDAQWLDAFESLKALSKDYYVLRRKWKAGQIVSVSDMAKLAKGLGKLHGRIRREVQQ